MSQMKTRGTADTRTGMVVEEVMVAAGMVEAAEAGTVDEVAVVAMEGEVVEVVEEGTDHGGKSQCDEESHDLGLAMALRRNGHGSCISVWVTMNTQSR